MYKFLLVLVVATLTACGSAKSEVETTADSTATGAVTVPADTVSADSTVVAPTTGENAK